MGSSVRDFAAETPNADYHMIVSRFGTPMQIAESYIAEMETSELLEGMQLQQKILLIALIAAALLFAIRFGFRAAAYWDFHKNMNGYAVVEVTEIERTVIDEGGK